MQELNWDKGTPTKAGMYFVAVEFGPAAGAYDFVEWDGSNWVMNTKGDVIAFVDIGSFIQQVSIKWPGEDKLDYKKGNLSSDDELWEEV